METLTVLLSPLTPPLPLHTHTHTHKQSTHKYKFPLCDQWRAHVCLLSWITVNIRSQRENTSALHWAEHTHLPQQELVFGSVFCDGFYMNLCMWKCTFCALSQTLTFSTWLLPWNLRAGVILPPSLLHPSSSSSSLSSLSPSSVIRRVIWGIWLLMTVPNPHTDDW